MGTWSRRQLTKVGLFIVSAPLLFFRVNEPLVAQETSCGNGDSGAPGDGGGDGGGGGDANCLYGYTGNTTCY